MHQLILLIGQTQLKPSVLRQIHHHQIDVPHGELPEIDGATLQVHEISPLLDARYIFLSVAVDLLEVRIDDAHAGQSSADMRGGGGATRILEDVIVLDLYAWNVG